MPTLWIHRSDSSDILVRYSEQRREDAITFARTLLNDTYPYDDYITDSEVMDYDLGIQMLGTSSHLQIILASSDTFHPTEYTSKNHPVPTSWNNKGFIQVAEDEARDLGITGEPEGFVPGSSQGIWKRDCRTVDELNAELDMYNTGRF